MSNPPSPSTPRSVGRARVALRVAALVALVAATGFWAAKGAHTGWSMDQVPVKQTDEITGIEFVTYDKRYVPGVDFLALGAGLAFGLFAVSLFVQRKSTQSNS